MRKDLHDVMQYSDSYGVPIELQPHLNSRGFVATELCILFGALFGALAGYTLCYLIAPRRHSWPRQLRLAFAAAFALIGAYLGYEEEFSILASSCLGYLVGLSLGSGVTLFIDDFLELGERGLPFRLFLVAWSPAVIGGLIGGLYNEIMHGSPLLIALLKILCAIAGSSVITFAWMFLIEAIDRSVARRAPLNE